MTDIPDPEITMDDVEVKMKQLGVTGWSCMANPSPAELMRGLETIEEISRRRKEAAREAMEPQPDVVIILE